MMSKKGERVRMRRRLDNEEFLNRTSSRIVQVSETSVLARPGISNSTSTKSQNQESYEFDLFVSLKYNQ